MVRVVCISDTHNKFNSSLLKLPQGDILIHSGDFSNQGTEEEVICFNEWMKSLPFKHKILVLGNHDYCEPDVDKIQKKFPYCTYIQDRSIQVEGINIYGSPWSGHNMAFHIDHDTTVMREIFNLIPNNIDILVTHIPPVNIKVSSLLFNNQIVWIMN